MQILCDMDAKQLTMFAAIKIANPIKHDNSSEYCARTNSSAYQRLIDLTMEMKSKCIFTFLHSQEICRIQSITDLLSLRIVFSQYRSSITDVYNS